MSNESIQAIAALQSGALPASHISATDAAMASRTLGIESSAQNSFGQMVSQGLQQVNSQLLTSQTDLQQLALGQAQNLHQIMIRLEESRLSFQLLMQVRNRLLESYQDVMKMQV